MYGLELSMQIKLKFTGIARHAWGYSEVHVVAASRVIALSKYSREWL